jgi:uroporphyrinogen decarboxylase
MGEKALLKAAQCLPSSRHPIWFLRQAGRYLPEYRDLRAQYEFLDLCKNPKLASEITLQPLKRFDVDAAIIFSDILIPAVALGQNLTFAKDHGPILSNTVRDESSLKNLRFKTCINDWNFVGEAISLVKSKLEPHQTMIGFAGAPFTLASYMIEGQGGTGFVETKRLAFCNPAFFKKFLMQLAEVTISYLQMQIQAGAEIIMLFDTWVQQVSRGDYLDLVKEATECIIAKISQEVPVIYYPGQGSDRLNDLANTQASVISVDWRTTLSQAQRILGESGLTPCLQGNLDPLVLIGKESFVRERVRGILNEIKQCKLPGHIFNVGHGLLPLTPIDSLNWVIDEIRSAK